MEQEKIKIYLVGDPYVGKTTFRDRFSELNVPVIYVCTFELETKEVDLKVGNQNYKLSLNDIPGKENFSSSALNKIDKPNAIIFMYDVNKEDTFKSIPKWIEKIKEKIERACPFILIGNQIDKKERKIQTEEGKKFADDNYMDFFEISSKTGENEFDPMFFIIKRILNLPEKFSEPMIINGYNLTEIALRNEKSCCYCCH